METGQLKTSFYKRSHFVTHLPEAYLYSPSHFWAAEQGNGIWRVGLTKFASRMLGEMVEHAVEPVAGASVASGQIIGWIEGFKAITDIYCIADGVFHETNPALKQKIKLVNSEPYERGWIYAVNGKPDNKCIDVTAYRALLDKTIDKILEKEGEHRE